MLKINSPKVNDTFSDIISENQRSLQQQNNSRSLVRKKNFASIKNTKEYTSPFRTDITGLQKTQLQALKTQRFPTTSATSDYNNLSTKELGFKKINDKDKRIKDIKFPQYLTENEIRQAGLINDLQGKEERLQYWNNSQLILDYTEKARKREARKNKENLKEIGSDSTSKYYQSRLNDQLEDAKILNPPKEINNEVQEDENENENATETASIPMFTNIGKLIEPTTITTLTTKNFVCMDSSNQSIINKNSLIDATDMTNRYKVLKRPLDPTLAPKVPYSDPSLAHKTTQGQNEAAEQVNPIASPDDKEMIVKVDNYGHLSKAVYDKVMYERDVHTNYLIDFQEEQDKKYNDKVARYEAKFRKIQKKKDLIEQQMNELKEDTLGKLEVIQNKLIKDMMDSNGKFVNDKTQIMQETRLTKLKKLNECKFYYQKQKLIQGQINSLGVERNNVYDDFTDFATHMNNVSGELDGKLFRLNQINYQSDQIRKEIDGLKQKKTTLQQEIETNQNTNETNEKTLAQLKTGEHEKNKTLDTINSTITDKLALLAVVKQEAENENLKISKLTDKINQKTKETEARMQKELDDNKANYEGIIAQNKTDLEEKIASLEENHRNEVEDITKDYDDKVAELQEKVAQQQKEKEEAKAALEKKIAQQEQEKEEAKAAAAKAKLTAAPENDSLYSYETEEEIVYQ